MHGIARRYAFVALITLSVVFPTIAANPSTQPATMPTADDTAKSRLIALRSVTIVAIDFADAHSGTLPTTEELAQKMGIPADHFEFVVLASGRLNPRPNKSKGDSRDIVVGEKSGGSSGKWAFGFADGHCELATAEQYKEWRNQRALEIISSADKP